MNVLRDRELGFPVKELLPLAPWNYAIVADGKDGLPVVETRGEGLARRLAVKAVRTSLGGWGTMRGNMPGRAVDPPKSPFPCPAKAVQETIELVPLALTQLRITFFRWTRESSM